MDNQTNNKLSDEQVDLFARTLVDHTERLDRMEEKLDDVVTKEDHQEIMNTLDTLVKLAQKKDEELTMMSHTMQKQHEEIEKIKPLVGLVF